MTEFQRASFCCLLALSAVSLSSCETFIACEGETQRQEQPAPTYSAISAARLEQIKATKTFKVAVCPGKPPFCMKSDAGLSGMDLDIINAVARELNLTPQYFDVPENDASGMLRDGTADLLCGAFDGPSISRQFLDSTLEYLPSGQRTVIRSEAASFVTDSKQLNSPKITFLCILGSTGSKQVATLFPEAKSSIAPNFEKALEELKASEGKILLIDNVELLKHGNLASDPKVKVVFGFLSSERLAMGIRRNDDAWRNLLEIGFRRAVASGEIGRIVGRYFPNVSVGTIDVKSAPATGAGSGLKLEIKQ